MNNKAIDVAKDIKRALEQGGHIQSRHGAEYGYIIEGGVETIAQVIERHYPPRKPQNVARASDIPHSDRYGW